MRKPPRSGSAGPSRPNDFIDPGGKGAFNSPFAKLGALRDELPSGSPEVSRSDFPEQPPSAGPARAVVRLERKGRGGKEVTVVEGLGLSDAELSEWLGALKRALGTGGTLEDGALVLQGDHRLKLPDLLLRRGVRRVSKG
ncbi:MAG: translation initiation factor [Myxococcales bacterium]|nr:translation initiation factor [Myxococcales bacterium]